MKEKKNINVNSVLQFPPFQISTKLNFLVSFYDLKFLFLSLLILPFTVSAQNKQNIEVKKRIETELKERGEVYIAVPFTGRKSGLSLFSSLNPGKIKSDTAFFYITTNDTTLLYSSNIHYTLLTAPSLMNEVGMASSEYEVLQGLAYPTYSQYLSIMQNFMDNYPEIITIDTIGYSIKNKLILGARMQPGNIPAETRPVVFLSSTIHGNEPLGYVLLLKFINELLQNYGVSSELSNLLNQLTLIINPLANPDGTYFVSDTTISGSIRNNLNNVDLNRNFPDPYKGWSYGPVRQPENIAMMNYMDKYKPSLSANLHGGAEVVNYPWDWAEISGSGRVNPHPDDIWFRFISSEYADAAKNGFPGYMNLFPGGITNGAYWYVVYGGRQDYVTGFLKGRELTLELSNDFIPPANQINWFYERNKQPLINFITQATYGLHGKIFDKETGNPLGGVKIKLQNHDDIYSIYSFIYSDSLTGVFHRYLKGDNYNVIFEKEGYEQQIAEVTIADYEKINLDIYMKSNQLVCIPNPFSTEFYAKFSSAVKGTSNIEIFSLTGQLIYSSSFNVVEGLNNQLVNPDLPLGVYILKITVGDEIWKKRIVKYAE